MLALVNGMLLCGGLIISIGPQNTELIRLSLLKNKQYILASTYVISDMLLIPFGAFGLGSLLSVNPSVMKVAGVLSSIFLIYSSILAFKRAYSVKVRDDSFKSNKPFLLNSSQTTIKLGLLLSFLNPLAIIETVLVIGGTSSQYHKFDKIFFIIGAITMSFIWFYGLAIAASKGSSLIQNKEKFYLLEMLSGAILLLSAVFIPFNLARAA